jgi:tyrosine-specific transport protein
MSTRGLGTFGGALIVSGTSIGAGMLALPVVTGQAGFFPSLVVLISSWAFMTITGLMYAELCLYFRKDSNIISLAEKTLGTQGKAIAWVLYLFLFYCLTIAYLVGGGNFLAELGVEKSDTFRIFIFAIIFISVILIGRKAVDPLNRLFMVGLFITYIAFVIIGAPLINTSYFSHENWLFASTALPVAFTSFGFQGTIPTLASWMHYDTQKIRRSIIIGTAITLVIYIVWQGLFLGIVPQDGPHGLQATLKEGRDAVHPLQYFTQSSIIWTSTRAFALLALITSFLGVGIGLIDFIADGLKIAKSGVKNIVYLALFAFLPPLLFAMINPHIFLSALGVAGGFGCAALLGFLPIIMTYNAKFNQKRPLFENSYLGNKIIYFILITFVSLEIVCEIANLYFSSAP